MILKEESYYSQRLKQTGNVQAILQTLTGYFNRSAKHEDAR